MISPSLGSGVVVWSRTLIKMKECLWNEEKTAKVIEKRKYRSKTVHKSWIDTPSANVASMNELEVGIFGTSCRVRQVISVMRVLISTERSAGELIRSACHLLEGISVRGGITLARVVFDWGVSVELGILELVPTAYGHVSKCCGFKNVRFQKHTLGPGARIAPSPL